MRILIFLLCHETSDLAYLNILSKSDIRVMYNVSDASILLQYPCTWLIHVYTRLAPFRLEKSILEDCTCSCYKVLNR